MQSAHTDKPAPEVSLPAGAYSPRRTARLRHANIRGLAHAVREWGMPDGAPVLLLHGWMDASPSWQFLIDALPDPLFDRSRFIAPDWRGFGDTAWPQDGYWFADYQADLDTLLDQLCPDSAVTLIGHSMGGNIACIYAGLRPARIAKLVSLEGFGLPDSPVDAAPERLKQWLDHLKAESASPATARPYADVASLAERLRRANPRLTVERSLYLAAVQSRPTADGLVLKHDPRHKAPGALPYRLADAMAAWRCVSAPTLWVQGDQSDLLTRFHGTDGSDLACRAACFAKICRETLTGAGHMLQHDQPEALARLLAEFVAD